MSDEEKVKKLKAYEKLAKARIEKGGFNIGDGVLISRKITTEESIEGVDFRHSWVSQMDRYVGTIQIVEAISHNYLQVRIKGYWYPIHILKSTKEKELDSASLSLQQVLEEHSAEETEKEFAESFDLERLAKECNDLFQGILDENLGTLTDQIETATTEFSNSISLASEDHIKMFLKEIERGRTIIQLPDSTEISVRAMDHPRMASVIKSLTLFKKVMLVGPAGTGKTYMVEQIAKRMKLTFYKYSCSRDSSVHDLLGYKQPASETYLETVFLKAYENGGIFLVDEYDAMSGDMSLFFNGVADGSKFISVPHRDDKPIAERHKDFYLVMCGNTWGKGSHEFTGRDFQDNALMDRFRLCREYIDYHIELEKEFAGVYYPILSQMRKDLEDRGSYLSTRNIEDISIAIRSGVDISEITEMIAQDLIEIDKKSFKELTAKSIAQHRSSTADFY